MAKCLNKQTILTNLDPGYEKDSPKTLGSLLFPVRPSLLCDGVLDFVEAPIPYEKQVLWTITSSDERRRLWVKKKTQPGTKGFSLFYLLPTGFFSG